MLAARAATKPKLSLAVPSLSLNTSAAAAGPKSPFSLHAQQLPSPSPLTPTSRNTKLNQKAVTAGFSTLQVPSVAKKTAAASKKSVQFSDKSPSVRLVSPMPRECYGEYVKMSREERRWTPRQG